MAPDMMHAVELRLNRHPRDVRVGLGLCDEPLAAADYLALADPFTVLGLDGVPALPAAQHHCNTRQGTPIGELRATVAAFKFLPHFVT